jgi:hypothetical protein
MPRSRLTLAPKVIPLTIDGYPARLRMMDADIELTSQPVPGKPPTVSFTLTIGGMPPIPFTLDASDTITVGRFFKQSAKTARYPTHRPGKGELEPPYRKAKHEDHDFTGDEDDDR